MHRSELDSLTVAELRRRFPGAPRSLKKQQLIERILDAHERRERRLRWEQEVLVRGYPSMLAAVNAVRAAAGLDSVETLERGPNPVAAALGSGHALDAYVTPGYLAILDGTSVVAEGLCDEWAYEFAYKLRSGAYPEWGTVSS